MENNDRFKGIPLCKGAPELGNACGRCARCRAPAKFQSGNEQFEVVCKTDTTIAHALAVLDPVRAYSFKHAAWVGWLAHESVTVGGVPRELLEVMLTAHQSWPSYDKARKELRALLDAPDECRCKRFGKDNPHWPCPVHTTTGAQPKDEPVAWVIETVDGRGADYYPGKGLDTLELGAKLYAEQPAPVADPLAKGFTTLESDCGKYKIVTSFATRDDAWSAYRALVGAKPAPGVVAHD